MKFRSRIARTLSAALVITVFASCEKSEEQAAKLPPPDESSFEKEFTELESFRLDNGIAVYMQEETSRDQVALEVLYRAGFVHEPAGQPQVSHVAEHAVIFAATEGYEANQASTAIKDTGGMISAEAVGDFVHFDYIVKRDHIEEVLKVESERLQSVRFDDDGRKKQAKRAASEIASVLSAERGTLKKFGLITTLHALQHGASFVPIRQANYDRTVDELAAFHGQYYRPENMLIVIVGNIDKQATRALVEKYFGNLPSTPEPPRYEINVGKNVSVQWDIDANAVCLTYPGPYNDKESVALVMFGSYLSQFISRDAEIPVMTTATFTTNPAYTVEYMPFFVYGDPAKYRSVPELRDKLIRLTDEAIASLDEEMFRRIKIGLTRYVTTSILESQSSNIQAEHHQIIGQHALGVAMRHYLKGGRSDEEYLAVIDGITLEDMREILTKHLSEDNRTAVIISGL